MMQDKSMSNIEQYFLEKYVASTTDAERLKYITYYRKIVEVRNNNEYEL